MRDPISESKCKLKIVQKKNRKKTPYGGKCKFKMTKKIYTFKSFRPWPEPYILFIRNIYFTIRS